MTVQTLLRQAASVLGRSRCHGDSARLDTEVLLAHVLQRDRTWLVAHGDEAAPHKVLRRFRALIRCRSRHEPVAYLTGYKNFYGLRFKVNRAVLIPRPETEMLVDLAVRSAGVYPPHAENGKRGTRPRATTTLLDVGTGSGAIAMAIAKTLPNARIIATDVSAAALKVARENARRLGVLSNIQFKVAAGFSRRWLRNLKVAPTAAGRLCVVANLPYLTTSEWRNTAPEIRNYEPRLALDGGRDGLKYYSLLLARVGRGLVPRHAVRGRGQAPALHLLLEIDPFQKQKMRRMVRRMLPRARIIFHKDLSQKDRVAEIITNY